MDGNITKIIGKVMILDIQRGSTSVAGPVPTGSCRQANLLLFYVTTPYFPCYVGLRRMFCVDSVGLRGMFRWAGHRGLQHHAEVRTVFPLGQVQSCRQVEDGLTGRGVLFRRGDDLQLDE